jgi:hypothetical protein
MLIAVEGCIGAGKSTIAQGLAALRKSDVLLESFESNPFLADFYDDPDDYAVETEFTFLLLHFHQLKSQKEVALSGELVADFHLGKDLVYADLNLKDSTAKKIFIDLHDFLKQEVPEPAVMLFLSASTDLIIERIRKRHRDFEMKIDSDYYAKINTAYEGYFLKYPGQKLKIPMDKWDFVQKPELFQKISQLLDDELKSM